MLSRKESEYQVNISHQSKKTEEKTHVVIKHSVESRSIFKKGLTCKLESREFQNEKDITLDSQAFRINISKMMSHQNWSKALNEHFFDANIKLTESPSNKSFTYTIF